MGGLERPRIGRRIVGIEARRIQSVHWIDKSEIKYLLPKAVGEVAREHGITYHEPRERGAIASIGRRRSSQAINRREGSGGTNSNTVGAVAIVCVQVVVVRPARILDDGAVEVGIGRGLSRRGIGRRVTAEARSGKEGRDTLGIHTSDLAAPQVDGVQMTASVVAQHAIITAETEPNRGAADQHAVVSILRGSARDAAA